MIPPQAIVVMVFPNETGFGSQIQAQWPPTMDEAGVIASLRAVVAHLEQQQALKQGGILKATSLAEVQ